MYYTRFETDICEVILIGDESGLKRIHLVAEDSNRDLEIKEEWLLNDDFFKEARCQLKAYFEGKRKTFDLKLNPDGTDFQKKVWQALGNIDYGQTVSYKDIAIEIGNEKASRAVGMANGKNPLPIVIPCHRVVGSNGKLTGYAFGMTLKEKIISLEKH
ncbi:methylated-DNA--[protein]-cysteine S-methyltransferase [Acidaminobacter sp. JC074]|uniref:methylated-DNA--[protein]-cysteine S-methyltransferase n=1 Tax=Acidaminobacter sp. JC074 TaxID=2530199 RepID=UPI00216C134F|nr:methylated-DNA--[protein]-cysteine S-methyltransferase [Acidaminobacter sp. JC074]